MKSSGAPALIGVILACASSGCATSAKPAEETDANGRKIEYVYYTPVGTNIPVRIRKDQLQASDQETAADQKTLRDILRKGRTQPSGN
ncbi:MAG TPA: hypothetical protein VHE61_00385 [Opitutaceae bacterium]|nr:hypothetical protein [Opitutaceae bacterium]